jgi:hypothetical protein
MRAIVSLLVSTFPEPLERPNSLAHGIHTLVRTAVFLVQEPGVALTAGLALQRVLLQLLAAQLLGLQVCALLFAHSASIRIN